MYAGFRFAPVLTVLLVLLGTIAQAQLDQVPDSPPPGDTAPAGDEPLEYVPPKPPGPASEDDDSAGMKQGDEDRDEAGRDFDPAQVASGQAAFNAHCVTCHDADKSLQKRKSFSGWLATVKRMAAKADADIPPTTHDPIAHYLASVAGTPSGGTGNGKEAVAGAIGIPGFTPNATIAPLLRATPDPGNNSPDFFVDAWFGADWQPGGALSASVMVCTSCHSDDTMGQAFSLELVDASITWDLKKSFDELCGNPCPQYDRWSLKLKGGRFIVPFGAFASMVHPAVLRTVDNPLIFDMGRRYDIFPYLPVLPGPYSDEGFNLNFTARLGEDEDIRASWDVYAVNGLQGDLNVSFVNSRSYRDNNRSPFTGTRLSVGNKTLRVGGSIMGGFMQDQPDNDLFMTLYGVDVVAQLGDKFRFYAEYALRENSELIFDNQNTTWGVVCEAEYKLCDRPRISLLARYDNLTQRGYLTFPDTEVDRYTWGVNTTLPGGSQLILNHEHWVFSGDRSSAELFAVKWVASF